MQGGGFQADEDTLADWKDAFDHFEEKKSGTLNAEQAQNAFLSCGRDFAPHEITNLLRDGFMDYTTFQGALNSKMKPPPNPNEIVSSLAVFDKEGNGKLSIPELRYAMVTMGEHFSELDVEEMTIEADPDGTGIVDYREFARTITAN